MITDLPDYISWIFILTTLATLYVLFYTIRSVDRQTGFIVFVILVIWLTATGKFAQDGFFLDFEAVPPRFLVTMPFVLLIIIGLFVVKNSRKFISELSVEWLTYLSVIRIPVEIILWKLMLFDKIPAMMTFEGMNYDIIAGISAPLIAYFCFTRNSWNLKIAYGWNIISLILLINIIVIAILSSPSPFQLLAFSNPNVGMFYFPFIWLPAFVAPTVLFSHLANMMIINKLLNE